MPRPATRAEVIAAVAALAPTRTSWIGIDGFGGAGKTTLAAAVAAAVPDVAVVHVDDFWGPSIAEWDWTRFREQVVTPLLAGRDARYQEWDWDVDRGGPWHSLPAGRRVVVEGVSATRAEAGVPWDLTVWVETPRETRLARALERDGPAAMARWHDEWIPSELAYAARQRPQQRVDLVVDGASLS
jgi:uridine kinase